MGQIIFGEEQKYFYPKIIGDIGIRGPPDLRWIRPKLTYVLFDSDEDLIRVLYIVTLWLYKIFLPLLLFSL